MNSLMNCFIPSTTLPYLNVLEDIENSPSILCNRGDHSENNMPWRPFFSRNWAPLQELLLEARALRGLEHMFLIVFEQGFYPIASGLKNWV